MSLEHDRIKKVIQKDVNNYMVVMEDGEVKSKGAYVKKLNNLDYDLPIVNKAIKEYFIKGVPVAQAWQEFLLSFKDQESELYSVCVPDCIYRGHCYEHKSCGYHRTEQYKK